MIAKRAQEIKPFIVMDVLDRARAMEHEGINIIQSLTSTPRHASRTRPARPWKRGTPITLTASAI